MGEDGRAEGRAPTACAGDVATAGHSVFPYPGNKAKHAAWILRHFPAHSCYVEPFGGAAGVLANKPESNIEVYNDAHGDLVQFFDTLRTRGEELASWLEDLPYAREKYAEWAPKWYDGWRPEDPVERAGVFFFLRATAFGAKYRYKGGFAISTSRNQATTYRNQIERLRGFAQRFRGQVVIEQLDYTEVLQTWDDSETLFYVDPPYPDATFRYRHGKEFDHEAFARALETVDGHWVVSYSTPPGCVRAVADSLVTRSSRYEMAAGYNGAAAEVTETLLCNFDPQSVEPFLDAQARLGQFGGGSDA
jgi:DNA adenine methylase